MMMIDERLNLSTGRRCRDATSAPPPKLCPDEVDASAAAPVRPAGAPSSTSEIRPEDELANFIPMAGSVVKQAGGD
jgi:hypothetical protein